MKAEYTLSSLVGKRFEASIVFGCSPLNFLQGTLILAVESNCPSELKVWADVDRMRGLEVNRGYYEEGSEYHVQNSESLGGHFRVVESEL